MACSTEVRNDDAQVKDGEEEQHQQTDDEGAVATQLFVIPAHRDVQHCQWECEDVQPEALDAQVVRRIPGHRLNASGDKLRVVVHQRKVLDRDKTSQAADPKTDAIREANKRWNRPCKSNQGHNQMYHLQRQAMLCQEQPNAEVLLCMVNVLTGIRWKERTLQNECKDSGHCHDALQNESPRRSGCVPRVAALWGEQLHDVREQEVPSDEDRESNDSFQPVMTSPAQLFLIVVVSPRSLRKQLLCDHG
mmetsp:Transcript_14233/g.50000  ORF Transcript_14233/g.50000 Transcript_14233/m.50000 type:complete len:248 (-) Transcript_14233:57-800(-)